MADLATLKVQNDINFSSVDGKTIISFTTDKLTAKEQASYKAKLEGKGDKLSLTLKKYSPHRSMNANAYFWVLADAIAESLTVKGDITTKEDIYRSLIAEKGKYKYCEINEEAVQFLVDWWSKNGLGWFVTRVDDGERAGTVALHLYYGSSTYTQAEMAELINAAVAECESLGIETMPPAELESLIKSWKGGTQ